MCTSKRARRFGGTYLFHFRVEEQSKQETNKNMLRLQPACAGFLLGLLFDFEDGGDILPRIIWLFQKYRQRYNLEDRIFF
jgi:hypothetical protein